MGGAEQEKQRIADQRFSPYVPVHFKYNGGRPPKLNRAWLEVLIDGANSPAGLHPIPQTSVGAAE